MERGRTQIDASTTALVACRTYRGEQRDLGVTRQSGDRNLHLRAAACTSQSEPFDGSTATKWLPNLGTNSATNSAKQPYIGATGRNG